MVEGTSGLLASAYAHFRAGTLTVVLLNQAEAPEPVSLNLPSHSPRASRYTIETSSDGSLWQTQALTPSGNRLSFTVPGYGVVTVHASAPRSGR